MRRIQLIALMASLTMACGGGQSTDSATTSGSGAEDSNSGQGGGGTGGGSSSDEFQLAGSDTAGQAHGDRPSEIEANATHAAMRLFVVDPETGPITGTVIKLTGPDGTAYYTGQTDTQGYGEVLVPVGQRYEIEYLSLGRRTATANVQVPEGPNQDIRLTMRHRQRRRATPPPAPAPGVEPTEAPPEPEGLVLEGILFDTGAATIQEESNPRLDRVVEFMSHMISARIRVSGHTDNVGNAGRNQALSQARAEAVRTYLVDHGIDGDRVEAVGYGDQQPVAPNTTAEGRAQNRRIEAIEL